MNDLNDLNDNPFLLVAELQMVSATKAKLRRQAAKYKRNSDAPMILEGLDKKLAQQSAQVRAYKRQRRALIRAQLMGPKKIEWLELTRVLRRMTIEDSAPLINHVRQAKWLHDADLDTRYVALSVIASAIVRLRTVNGYDPFDDSLPGEEPTAFEIIRGILKTTQRELGHEAHTDNTG